LLVYLQLRKQRLFTILRKVLVTYYKQSSAGVGLGIQDDVIFAPAGSYEINSVTIGYYIAAGMGTTDLTLTLYGAGTAPNAGALLGTYVATGLPEGFNEVTFDLTLSPPVPLMTNSGYLGVMFSNVNAGWVFNTTSTVGSNNDLFWKNFVGPYWFGGNPKACFYASIDGSVPPTVDLNFDSYPVSVDIDVNPPGGPFPTPGTINYPVNSVVTLTAPASVGLYTFQYWKVDGAVVTGNPINVTMSGTKNAKAIYKTDSTPYDLYSNKNANSGYSLTDNIQVIDDFAFEGEGSHKVTAVDLGVLVPTADQQLTFKIYDYTRVEKYTGTFTVPVETGGWYFGTIDLSAQDIVLTDGGYLGVELANDARWIILDGLTVGSNEDIFFEGFTTWLPTSFGSSPKAMFAGSVTGNYFAAPNAVLTVQSANPASGVTITIDKLDVNGNGSGVAPLSRTYGGVNVKLDAPATAPNGNVFDYWEVDGTTTQFANPMYIPMAGTNRSATAHYASAATILNGTLTTTTGCNLTGWSYKYKVISTGETGTGVVGAGGAISMTVTSTGTSDICIKLNKGLSVKAVGVVLTGTVELGSFEVFQPDVMDDDVWDDFDLNEVNGGFGNTITPGDGADYNCDGVYDDFDLNQINGGFGSTGACFGLW